MDLRGPSLLALFFIALSGNAVQSSPIPQEIVMNTRNNTTPEITSAHIMAPADDSEQPLVYDVLPSHTMTTPGNSEHSFVHDNLIQREYNLYDHKSFDSDAGLDAFLDSARMDSQSFAKHPYKHKRSTSKAEENNAKPLRAATDMEQRGHMLLVNNAIDVIDLLGIRMKENSIENLKVTNINDTGNRSQVTSKSETRKKEENVTGEIRHELKMENNEITELKPSGDESEMVAG